MPIHIDMDAFFASIEQRDIPLYKGKPLIVCHTDDALSIRGIVSTSSYEAREYGVRSAMSVLEAKRLCPDGIYVKGSYDKYLHNAKTIHEICLRYSDKVEIYSVDEFFIDARNSSRLFGGEVDIGLQIQNKIAEEIGLPCSIGIGPNKLVAKMASEFKKPRGLTVIEEADLPDAFAPLPVYKLVGVGRKMRRHLNSMGIFTIGDLAGTPEDELKSRFGIVGTALRQASLGMNSSTVHSSFNLRESIKSFGHSSALGKGLSDLDRLTKVLLGLTEGVTRRMRKEGYAGRTVNIRLSMARLFTVCRSKSMAVSSDLTDDVYPMAVNLLNKESQLLARYPVTTIGVSVSNLTDMEKGLQLSVLDLLENRAGKIASVMDSIRGKFGERAVLRASLSDWGRRYHSVPRLEIK
jgi:DNA polymerase-4